MGFIGTKYARNRISLSGWFLTCATLLMYSITRLMQRDMKKTSCQDRPSCREGSCRSHETERKLNERRYGGREEEGGRGHLGITAIQSDLHKNSRIPHPLVLARFSHVLECFRKHRTQVSDVITEEELQDLGLDLGIVRAGCTREAQTTTQREKGNSQKRYEEDDDEPDKQTGKLKRDRKEG